MVLVLDVGNTNIKFGMFQDEQLLHSWRMHSDILKTADDYGINVTAFFNRVGANMTDVDGIIISSVIPAINYTLEHMCKIYFNIKPIFVGPGIKTGLNIKYDDPKELGADRIVNAVSSLAQYGGPCIILDFGTAMTFGAVSQQGEFLGGAIFPGFRIAMKALASDTARLSTVELIKPKSVINRSTKTGIQAGMIYGYVGLCDYMIEKIRQELNTKNVNIIGTGGLVELIANESSEKIIVNPLLTLQGLKILYDRNKQ